MSTRRDVLHEARALYEEAVAAFEAAKADFERVHQQIQASLQETRDVRAGLLQEEEAARARLFITRVQLSRRREPH